MPFFNDSAGGAMGYLRCLSIGSSDENETGLFPSVSQQAL